MKSEKILIVEDELIAAANIARNLEKQGYQVTAKVNSGEKALEQVEKNAPDLVLMDIMLRGKLDGIETASTIRDKYQIPIVYMTAYADRDTLDRAKQTEPYGYLVKPFKSQDISTTIEMALQKRKGEKKLEEEFEKITQINELQSQTIAIASHDLRTPLTTILCSADLLKNYHEKLSAQKKIQHLDRIKVSVSNMTDLLEDLLFLHQLDADKISYHPTDIELTSFFQLLIEQLQPISDRHQLCLAVEDSNFSPENEGKRSKFDRLDEKLLRQILTNLLSNAIKYSPEGGKVILEVTREAQQVTLRVRDWGLGIPASFQARLFQQFERAENVRSIQGTGLGLFIVKQAVKQHRGSISVESEEGVGTTFTVTLPSTPQESDIHSTTHIY